MIKYYVIGNGGEMSDEGLFRHCWNVNELAKVKKEVKENSLNMVSSSFKLSNLRELKKWLWEPMTKKPQHGHGRRHKNNACMRYFNSWKAMIWHGIDTLINLHINKYC
jgi:hypothetical protein